MRKNTQQEQENPFWRQRFQQEPRTGREQRHRCTAVELKWTWGGGKIQTEMEALGRGRAGTRLHELSYSAVDQAGCTARSQGEYQIPIIFPLAHQVQLFLKEADYPASFFHLHLLSSCSGGDSVMATAVREELNKDLPCNANEPFGWRKKKKGSEINTTEANTWKQLEFLSSPASILSKAALGVQSWEIRPHVRQAFVEQPGLLRKNPMHGAVLPPRLPRGVKWKAGAVEQRRASARAWKQKAKSIQSWRQPRHQRGSCRARCVLPQGRWHASNAFLTNSPSWDLSCNDQKTPQKKLGKKLGRCCDSPSWNSARLCPPRASSFSASCWQSWTSTLGLSELFPYQHRSHIQQKGSDTEQQQTTTFKHAIILKY